MPDDRELRHRFERFYATYVQSASTLEDEALLADELLGKARAGAFPDENGTLFFVRREARGAGPREVNSHMLQTAQSSTWSMLAGSWTTWAGLVMLVGVAIYLFLSTRDSAPVTMAPAPTAVVAGAADTQDPSETATPWPTMTPGPTPTPRPLPPVPADNPRALTPNSVELGGRFFPVFPTTVQPGLIWAYVLDPSTMSWLQGSYLNTVLALPWTAENEALIRDLGNQPIVLRYNTGQTHIYTPESLEEVSAYQIEVLRQGVSGLTIVLVNPPTDSPVRLVLRAMWQGSGSASQGATRFTPSIELLPTETPFP
jgi:hypothetical protein